ncbi:MAG: Glycosyltransferase [uncultured Acidimicrobiales bacterium]|uniref:Glycosyltransferase n=1 Tax=uncultured Acidimicrobiales bacterium TaxID=310071 RepID=A0A6J4HSS7_9ACTN|nr:MAG: Glycosyltransferase [uncultured Acidimicrobiales bacterium]
MPDPPIRIALLVYRGNPHSGGQGVYTRELSKELVSLGHRVTVFSGQPWPQLTEGVGFVPVPSLDLYHPDHPFRPPLHPRAYRTWIDLLEVALMSTGAFPEPLTFSLRVRRLLAACGGDFDLVHDNQCLGRGIGGLLDDGWPVLATLHHPITVDREIDVSHADTRRRRLGLRRWYSFLNMQMRVLPRIPRVVTVSDSSKRDICAQMGARPERVHVVPVGVDLESFRPLPGVDEVPGRIVCTTSSDMPLKGLVPLLEAVAKLRTERPEVELHVIGGPRQGSTIPGHLERLGLEGSVVFHKGIETRAITELYASCQVACVPSLYEGFSLPAIEAMACAVALVATTGGALPEVVGTDGQAGLLVPPGDPEALAAALARVLDDPSLREKVGQAGRTRVLERFTWRRCAEATVAQYRAAISDHSERTGPA